MSKERSKIILVAVDTSAPSSVALDQAYNLARITNSKIVLLSVDDGKTPNIKGALESLSKDSSTKTSLPLEILIKKGDVFDEINKVADELNPLFIVISIHRVEGDNIRGKNKNALKLIRFSEHPIISIGGKTHINECKKILLPLDLSMTSREKIPKTVDQ